MSTVSIPLEGGCVLTVDVAELAALDPRWSDVARAAAAGAIEDQVKRPEPGDPPPDNPDVDPVPDPGPPDQPGPPDEPGPP